MPKKNPEKELKEKVEKIHKATRTTFTYFQPIHDKLRQKSNFYYWWHTFTFSNYIHWLILFFAIFGFLKFVGQMYKIWHQYQYPEYKYTILGKRDSKNFIYSSNIDFDKGSIILAKKDGIYNYLGALEIKIDSQREVIWDKVYFSGEFPKGTKIKMRLKTSNIDDEKNWEKTPWSNFFDKNEIKISYLGVNPESRYLVLGVYLESDAGLNTPRLEKIEINYIEKPQPSKFNLWLQEKIRKYLPVLFEKIYQRSNVFGH